MMNLEIIKNYSEKNCKLCDFSDNINLELYDKYNVKRGLRDKNGSGVVTGLTNISRVDGFKFEDGKKTPCDGKLWYRGHNVFDIVDGFKYKRFGFEEITYLLLFGKLPNKSELEEFTAVLSAGRNLPPSFTRDVIMKAPALIL